jgi:hypothetical protein
MPVLRFKNAKLNVSKDFWTSVPLSSLISAAHNVIIVLVFPLKKQFNCFQILLHGALALIPASHT